MPPSLSIACITASVLLPKVTPRSSVSRTSSFHPLLTSATVVAKERTRRGKTLVYFIFVFIGFVTSLDTCLEIVISTAEVKAVATAEAVVTFLLKANKSAESRACEPIVPMGTPPLLFSFISTSDLESGTEKLSDDGMKEKCFRWLHVGAALSLYTRRILARRCSIPLSTHDESDFVGILARQKRKCSLYHFADGGDILSRARAADPAWLRQSLREFNVFSIYLTSTNRMVEYRSIADQQPIKSKRVE